MLPLTSVRLLVLLGGLCLAAVVSGALARRLLPAHPVVLRVVSGAAALLLGLAGVGAGFNRHYGLYRTWHDLLGTHSPDLVSVHGQGGLQVAVAPLPPGAPSPMHGTLFQIDIPGPHSGVAPRAAFVYLPPQYRDPAYSTATFPVVEAFQGSPGRPSDWIRGLHLDQVMDRAIHTGRVAPSIVVMPDTNGGLARSLECADTADGKNDEQFLVTDVHAWVVQNLRATAGRWASVGYSTGGYCALDLSIRHPDQYYAAVSLDGYAHALQDHYARGIWRSVPDRLTHSPDWLVANSPPELLDIYLLAGLSDPSSVREAVRFWDELGHFKWRRRHSRLVIQQGGRHTFPAWESALAPALSWALPGPAALDAAQAPLDGAALLASLPTPTPTATTSPSCPAPSGGPSANPQPDPYASPTGRPSARPTPSASARPTLPARSASPGPTPGPTGAARPGVSPSPHPTPPPTRTPVPAASPHPRPQADPSSGCGGPTPRPRHGAPPPPAARPAAVPHPALSPA